MNLFWSIITPTFFLMPIPHLFKKMWGKDEESIIIIMLELSLPAIRENYYKFDRFIMNDLY